MQLTAVLNGGIGDLIHCHAMLDTARGRFSDVAVALDERRVAEARSERHVEFSRRLMAALFREPDYKIVTSDSHGMTPQSLLWHGLVVPAAPDLRLVLPVAGVEPPPPFVAVSTKVRGWHRREYEAIREEFLSLLERIAQRVPLVLIGERVISQTPEYTNHHTGLVYSIYDDLFRLPCIDDTFPEFGDAPADWDQFRSDCTTMLHAERVVTLGSGGNVSMGMACGNCLAMIGGTEMGQFFESMPPDPRLTLCKSVGEYLDELRGMA